MERVNPEWILPQVNLDPLAVYTPVRRGERIVRNIRHHAKPHTLVSAAMVSTDYGPVVYAECRTSNPEASTETTLFLSPEQAVSLRDQLTKAIAACRRKGAL